MKDRWHKKGEKEWVIKAKQESVSKGVASSKKEGAKRAEVEEEGERKGEGARAERTKGLQREMQGALGKRGRIKGVSRG